MTREEAIDILFGCIEAHSEEENEALDMAIEALQTPPISQRSMYQAGYRQGREEALQTDIVQCEECEWWQKQDDSLQGRCTKYGFYPTGRYFCAGGERREDKDYERATEQLEHDIRYEPTYNQGDGSM